MRAGVMLFWCAAAASVAASPQTDVQALQRMAATERAFAAATAEIGVRDGFLSFFSDDSVRILRTPAPAVVPAREGLIAQALPKLPLTNKLIWEPYTGHISSDGTLGWLTGAFVIMNQAERTPVGQGAYFSVWKRQSNGLWRVWLDEGVQLPKLWMDAAPFRVAPEPDRGTAGSPRETIDAAESSVESNAEAWRARLAADVRIHIDGQMPLAGREAVLASPRANVAMTFRVLRKESAASDDLAVTIGAFDGKLEPAVERGSWVRVWKRDATGRWRIVFETATPAR